MNQLAKKEISALGTIEELQEYILIGREKLKAYQVKINAIKNLGLSKDVRDKALEDSQSMATALLYAEAKLGELLKNNETSHGGSFVNKKGGSKKSLPPGISHKQSHFAQTLAEHKDKIEEVIQEAREREDIPTRLKVYQRVKAMEKQKRVDEIRTRPTPELPERKYRCIVIDPPWPMKKIERKERPNQGIELDYPTMSIEEIKAFPLADMAERDGCHIYLWTTHKYLPIAFEIFTAWGVEYQCLLTWVKNIGFTPFSFMYSTEHVLFGRIGSLDLLKNGERLDFQAKATGHSVKPDIFYNLVKKVSPEPRIDIFNRREIKGFDYYGNETNLSKR